MVPQALNGLNDPHVRALAWSLLCPNLCQFSFGSQQRITHPELRQWLEDLDRTPSSLHRFLDQHPTHQLGIRHELLIFYYLKNSPQFTDLIRSHPILKQKKTLGELDFLVRKNHYLDYLHLEVSFKFFIGTSAERNPERWLGPNPNDHLANKMARLSQHQLPLSQNPHAKALLQPKVVNSGLGWIKGCLFYPLNEFESHHLEPIGVNPNHWRGWWLQDIELEELGEGLFWPLERMQWLTPQFSPNDEELINAEQLRELEWRRPTLIARMVESTEGWLEQDRGFILPRSWPS